MTEATIATNGSKGQVMGSCLCGEVSFSIVGEAVAQLLCFCSDCRKISGADSYAAYVVPRAALTLEAGTPTSYTVTAASGRLNKRNFCGTCGSRLWADLEMNLASVSGTSLNDPELFQPTMVHCESDAPTWARIPEHMESLPPSS
jgi:hypothetical protein